MKRKIKIGLVGVGGHGRTIRRAIQTSGLFEVVSCFDPDEKALDEAAEQFHCIRAKSDREVLTLPGLEAVAIVSPNHLHRQQAELAAASGKHIFLEKPIANTVEDGRAIVKAARDAGVILQVGHHVRKYAAFRQAKELIDSGKLGNIVAIEGNFSAPSGLDQAVPQWKTHKTTCPVVPLMQLGIHGFDTLLYLIGPIAEGFSYQQHTFMPGDTLDSSVSLLKFQNGVLGTFSSHYVARHAFYLNIFGTEYNAFLEFKSVTLTRLADGRDEHLRTVFTQPDEQAYNDEMEEFGRCILNGTEPEVTGEVGLQNLLVLEALIQSNELRKPVPVQMT